MVKLAKSKALKEQLEDEVRVKLLGEDENKVMLERMGYVGKRKESRRQKLLNNYVKLMQIIGRGNKGEVSEKE